jgi:hypothetical protein
MVGVNVRCSFSCSDQILIDCIIRLENVGPDGFGGCLFLLSVPAF